MALVSARGLAATLLLLTCGARDLRAEEPIDPSQRKGLLARAEAARAEGRHEDALELARRAGRVKMTSSLRRFLAEELLAVGKEAKAYEEARRCTDDAASEPPSANHDAVFLGCRSLVHDLAKKVALLSFDWGGAPPDDYRITLDGELLDRAPEHAASPGQTRLEIAAAGRKSLAMTVDLRAGESRVVEARLEDTPSAKRAPHGDVASALVAVPAAPQEPARSLHSRPWATIAIGTGAASAVAGLALWIASDVRTKDLETRCGSPGSRCLPNDPEISQVRSLETWGNVTVIGGLGLAAVGSAWLLIDHKPEPTTKVALDLQLGPRSVSVAGTF